MIDSFPGKEKEPGWRYLVVSRTIDGLILAYYGPYGAASNDLTLLHHYNVVGKLQPAEFFLGDSLFRCTLQSCSPFLLTTTSDENQAITPRHPLKEYDEVDFIIRTAPLPPDNLS